jgi:hypothetical protein
MQEPQAITTSTSQRAMHIALIVAMAFLALLASIPSLH